MRAVLVLVVILAVLGAEAAAPKKPVAPKKEKEVGARCDKGFVDVGSNLCCPKDHPQLVDGQCYGSCGEGSDDMVLGSWVGCRDQCDGGYSSSINSCTNGILTRERKDHTRNGVAPTPARALHDVPAKNVRVCPKGYVPVTMFGTGKFKHGGCCPKALPTLIAGHCYGSCDADKDEITIGSFVGCRAKCPDGWDEHTNHCSKSHEEDRDRGDFPRASASPVDRVVVPRPTPKEDPSAGCSSGWVGASKHYCCPATEPVLKGLLCYERCKAGFVEAGFGCRKVCPKGWTEHTLTCAKGSQSVRRDGYERAPKPSRLRRTL